MTINAGQQLHWLASGVTFHLNDSGLSATAAISRRGQTFIATAEMLEANKDREGRSIFDIAADAEAQLQRYGREILGVGPAPEGLHSWEPGTHEATMAAEQARRTAAAITDDRERAVALAAVRRDFGLNNPSNQRSSNQLGDTERLEYLRREGLAV